MTIVSNLRRQEIDAEQIIAPDRKGTAVFPANQFTERLFSVSPGNLEG